MSDIVDLYRQDEGRVLDRLADGELTDPETRELLGALDQDGALVQETGAWRRCALAFLEAQALRCEIQRGDLHSLYCEPPKDVSARQSRPFIAVRKWRWTRGLALAASLVLTFSLGMLLGRDNGLSRHTPGTQPTMAKNAPAPHVARLAGIDPSDADDGWRTVKLGVDDGAQGIHDIELPVRDVANIDPDWNNDESALSAEDEEKLQQSGHIVTRERELWPIELQDGRSLVVPVEQVEVRYVGYQ